MAREVVPLRLAEDEKAAIAKAAAALKITVSEFLRRAALLAAFRLDERTKPAPSPPEPKWEPPAVPVTPTPHYSATYSSWEQYQTSSPYVSGGPVFPQGGTMREG